MRDDEWGASSGQPVHRQGPPQERGQNLRAGEGGLAVAVIDHDEIISGPVHFREVQHKGGELSTAPARGQTKRRAHPGAAVEKNQPVILNAAFGGSATKAE